MSFMKNLFKSFLVAAALLVAVACGTKPVEVEVSLHNNGDSIFSFGSTGGEFSLSFTSSASWTLSSSREWVFVDQNAGQAGTFELTAFVEENTSGASRSAEVTVTADSKAIVVTVEQDQNNVFGIATTVFTVSSDGQTVEIPVCGNVDFKVHSMNDWITYVETKAVVDNKVVVECAENVGYGRTGGLKISSSEGEVLIRIDQEGAITDEIVEGEMFYRGDYYENGTANWQLYLYDKGFDLMEGEQMNSYCFDIIVDAKYDFLTYPSGLFEGTFVTRDDYTPGSIDEYSVITDYVNSEYVYFESATLTITPEMISAEIVDENGKLHKLKWKVSSRKFAAYDNSYRSSITKDYSITYADCEVITVGQYFIQEGIQSNQTFLSLYHGSPSMGKRNAAYNEGMILLNTPEMREIEGDYVVTNDFANWTVDIYNTFFACYDSNYNYIAEGQVGISSGTLTLRIKDGVYTVEGHFIDDFPYGDKHKLDVYYEGVPQLSNANSASSKARSLIERNKYRITL